MTTKKSDTANQDQPAKSAIGKRPSAERALEILEKSLEVDTEDGFETKVEEPPRKPRFKLKYATRGSGEATPLARAASTARRS